LGAEHPITFVVKYSRRRDPRHIQKSIRVVKQLMTMLRAKIAATVGFLTIILEIAYAPAKNWMAARK